MPETSKMFIFSGLLPSRRLNGEKLTSFKIGADTLMTFAREFFLRKIRNRNLRQSHYNVVKNTA